MTNDYFLSTQILASPSELELGVLPAEHTAVNIIRL